MKRRQHKQRVNTLLFFFFLFIFRCLDVPLFERGYGRDAAAICKEALKYAKEEQIDVVLIDTAGRMQVYKSINK